MALNPIPFVLLAALGGMFTLAIGGSSIADKSFPTPTTVDPDQCNSGFLGLGSFFCGIAYALSWIINFFKILFGCIAFLFNVLSFNITGAPWYARIPIGIIEGGSVLISIVTILRGN